MRMRMRIISMSRFCAITADFGSSCTVQLDTVFLALVVLVDDIKLTPSFLVCLFVCLCMCVLYL